MKNIKSAVIKTVSLIVIALIIVSAMSGCSIGRKKIDLKDYITVSYSSFNKHANVSFEVDEEKLNDAVEHKKVFDFLIENDSQIKKDLETYKALGIDADEEKLAEIGMFTLSNVIFIDLKEEYKNLSNGDKVVLEVKPVSNLQKDVTIKDIEKGLGISFASTEIEYTVSGLKDAVEINILEKVKDFITYTGPSGIGKADFELPEDCKFQIKDLYFKRSSPNQLSVICDSNDVGQVTVFLDKENSNLAYKSNTIKELSSGDEFTLELSLSDTFSEFLTSHTMICGANLKMKVPDIGEYVQVSDISQKDIDEFKTQALEKINEEYSYLEIVGLYKVTAKPDEEWGLNSKSTLAVIFGHKWGKSAFLSTYYSVCYSNGIVKTSDGKLTFDLNMKNLYANNADGALKEYSYNCTCEKIG